ncbi:MAG: hypothetical protein Q7U16_12170, partial [Agitococcus sp.]|nr:hypothetical protein [Agitococcus sp.]
MNVKKLKFVVLFCLANGLFIIQSHAETVLPTDKIFPPESFWYSAIPRNVELHENSAAFVTEFLRQKSAYYGNVSINTTSYASPVYYVDANVPTTQVVEWNCQNKKTKDEGLAEQWSAVPVPAFAIPANGTDAEMSIYQA